MVLWTRMYPFTSPSFIAPRKTVKRQFELSVARLGPAAVSGTTLIRTKTWRKLGVTRRSNASGSNIVRFSTRPLIIGQLERQLCLPFC